MKLLTQLYYLRSLTGQPALAIADEDFTKLRERISETRAGVMVLESMLSAPASADVKRVRDVVNSLREEKVFAQDQNTPNVNLSAQLGEAISALYSIYHTEIK